MSEEARSKLERVLALVPALVDTLLGWVRRLAILGVALALIDAALFVFPRRDESSFLVGAVLVLVFSLLPPLALHLLGRRFAAFRDGVGTIRQRLPEVTTLPRSFSASTTVVQYGPRDVLLAAYGILGLVILAVAVPVLVLWAVLA